MLLDVKDIAEILKVSREHVRQLIREGKIKAYKEGRRGGYRTTKGCVEDYVAGRLNREGSRDK